MKYEFPRMRVSNDTAPRTFAATSPRLNQATFRLECAQFTKRYKCKQEESRSSLFPQDQAFLSIRVTDGTKAAAAPETQHNSGKVLCSRRGSKRLYSLL